MSFKNLTQKLHLTEDEHSPIQQSQAAQANVPVHPQPAAQTSYATPNYIVPGVPDASNPDIVTKIKDSVLSVSPVIKAFITNVEAFKAAIPDETTCMKAALVSTKVDKNALLQELNGPIAASLLHTKNNLENDYKNQHDTAVHDLEAQLAKVNADIGTMTNQIAQLQQQVGAKQAQATSLQNDIQTTMASLQQQHNSVTASYATVEQYFATLGQTFNRL